VRREAGGNHDETHSPGRTSEDRVPKDILDNPRLIEAARKKMEEDLSSGKLDLR